VSARWGANFQGVAEAAMCRGARRGGRDWPAGECRRAGRKSPEVLGAYQTTRVDTSLEEVGGGIGGGGG
jgi:hypothetical protein